MVAFVLVYYSFQSLSEFEAFDMYVNDKLVFSKEKVGRYPTDEVRLFFPSDRRSCWSSCIARWSKPISDQVVSLP